MDYHIAGNIGGNSYLVKVYYKLYYQMLIDLVLVMSGFSKELTYHYNTMQNK